MQRQCNEMNKIKKLYKRISKNFFGVEMPVELKEVYMKFRNSPESGWIIGPQEAVVLYDFIRKEQPKNVLELGGGIGASAAVAAAAIEKGKITSLEQNQKCIKIAGELVPQYLKNKIMFIFSGVHAFKCDKISPYLYFSGYKNLSFLKLRPFYSCQHNSFM